MLRTWWLGSAGRSILEPRLAVVRSRQPVKDEAIAQLLVRCNKSWRVSRSTPETAAGDDPGADTSTPPIPQESADRKRSGGASYILQAHPLRSGQSIRAAVASLSENPVHPSPGNSSLSSSCGASASHLRSTTFSLAGQAAVRSRFAVELSSPSPSLSLMSNEPAFGLDSSCPIAARSPASTAPSVPSLLRPWPLQRDFSRGRVKLLCFRSSSSPF